MAVMIDILKVCGMFAAAFFAGTLFAEVAVELGSAVHAAYFGGGAFFSVLFMAWVVYCRCRGDETC